MPISAEDGLTDPTIKRPGAQIFVSNYAVPDAVNGDSSPKRARQESRIKQGQVHEPPASIFPRLCQHSPVTQVKTKVARMAVP
jgi:hypothetical protein